MMQARPAGRPAVASNVPAVGGESFFTDMAAREQREKSEKEVAMAKEQWARRKRHDEEQRQRQPQPQPQRQPQPQPQRQRQHPPQPQPRNAVASTGVATAVAGAASQQPSRDESMEFHNCVVCHELCIEPAWLPACIHTGLQCKECVYMHVATRGERDASCPQCRNPYGPEAKLSRRALKTNLNAWGAIEQLFPKEVKRRKVELAEQARQEVAQAAVQKAEQEAARRPQRPTGGRPPHASAPAPPRPRAADANGRMLM
jgi:hypothetical protein